MTNRRDFIKKSVLGTTGLTIGSIGLISGSCNSSPTVSKATQNVQSSLPRPVIPMTEEYLGRKPLNLYGGYEDMMQKMRSYRPLDLNAVEFKKANPASDYKEWAGQARECLSTGLHYNLPPVNLQAEIHDKIETGSFIRDRIFFKKTIIGIPVLNINHK